MAGQASALVSSSRCLPIAALAWTEPDAPRPRSVRRTASLGWRALAGGALGCRRRGVGASRKQFLEVVLGDLRQLRHTWNVRDQVEELAAAADGGRAMAA